MSGTYKICACKRWRCWYIAEYWNQCQGKIWSKNICIIGNFLSPVQSKRQTLPLFIFKLQLDIHSPVLLLLQSWNFTLFLQEMFYLKEVLQITYRHYSWIQHCSEFFFSITAHNCVPLNGAMHFDLCFKQWWAQLLTNVND